MNRQTEAIDREIAQTPIQRHLMKIMVSLTAFFLALDNVALCSTFTSFVFRIIPDCVTTSTLR